MSAPQRELGSILAHYTNQSFHFEVLNAKKTERGTSVYKAIASTLIFFANRNLVHLKTYKNAPRADTINEYLNYLNHFETHPDALKVSQMREERAKELIAVMSLGVVVNAVTQIVESGKNGKPYFDKERFNKEYLQARANTDLPEKPKTDGQDYPEKDDEITDQKYKQICDAVKEDETLSGFFSTQNYFHLLPGTLKKFLLNSGAYLTLTTIQYPPSHPSGISLLSHYRDRARFVFEQEGIQQDILRDLDALDTPDTKAEGEDTLSALRDLHANHLGINAFKLILETYPQAWYPQVIKKLEEATRLNQGLGPIILEVVKARDFGNIKDKFVRIIRSNCQTLKDVRIRVLEDPDAQDKNAYGAVIVTRENHDNTQRLLFALIGANDVLQTQFPDNLAVFSSKTLSEEKEMRRAKEILNRIGFQIFVTTGRRVSIRLEDVVEDLQRGTLLDMQVARVQQDGQEIICDSDAVIKAA